MTAAQVTEIVTAVNYAEIIAGIAGVATAVAAVYITFKGVKLLMGAVRGA